MMEWPKIQLSSAEISMMQDADLILTKNRVMEKMKALLGIAELAESNLVNEMGWSSLPIFKTSPKISRGENYLGLPWLILDYPRLSSSEGHFFIRQFFWWGRGFSSTLHLSGIHKQEKLETIIRNIQPDHLIGVNDDQWVHHFGEDNYKEAGTMESENIETMITKGGHIKISRQWPLSEWEDIPQKMVECWLHWLKVSGSVTQAME